MLVDAISEIFFREKQTFFLSLIVALEGGFLTFGDRFARLSVLPHSSNAIS